VAGHRRALPADAGPLERGVPLPVHVRDRTAGTGLRWALKTAAPAGPAGDRWGDRHFALALAAALERLGEQAVVDPLPAHERPSAHLDDVVLCLRGKAAVAPPAAGLSVLWVISHPGLVTDEELLAHDVVCAAGPAWAARAAERTGREVVVLLQATDPARFHPGAAGAAGAASAGGDEVVFVGNSRGVQRPVVRDLLAAGVDVALHGAGWERFVPPSRVRSTHVPNEELSALYGSAGVVLNDHWDDMRADGFLSNRLFDAAASGARVVTDAVLDQPGLDRLFHGLVRAYADRDELLALVAERAGFPDDAERARRGALVGREHSFDARARELVRRVHGLRGLHGLHGGVPVLG
jgi:hypothetical protein